jgi:hypothetical protein
MSKFGELETYAEGDWVQMKGRRGFGKVMERVVVGDEWTYTVQSADGAKHFGLTKHDLKLWERGKWKDKS